MTINLVQSIVGMSNRARSDIRTFASGIRMFAPYMSDHFRILYVRAYCSIYVKIVLIIKDDGFADENVGWTCLPSTPEQSERFKFDVHISSIISSLNPVHMEVICIYANFACMQILHT